LAIRKMGISTGLLAGRVDRIYLAAARRTSLNKYRERD